MRKFDLLETVTYGGCSAKLSPDQLGDLLKDIPLLHDKRIMVDIETHDDAGVYRLNDETALIVTTDFFPPLCSDPFTFGTIAAANALSDVYAMGGTPLLTLNLTMFPASGISLDVLKEILQGGQQKVNEAGAFMMGGHTIEDPIPKYGLAVVGTVHPDRLITNSGARIGQKLILTKPLGAGVVMAAHRMEMADADVYTQMLEQMSLLNRHGMEVMQHAGVKGATDITGFGLLGHAMRMAQASHVSFEIESAAIPCFKGVDELLDDGCIPGAAFRNNHFVQEEVHFSHAVSTADKMLLCDAQTSGGLLMAVDKEKADEALKLLQADNIHPQAAIIGDVIEKGQKAVWIF